MCLAWACSLAEHSIRADASRNGRVPDQTEITRPTGLWTCRLWDGRAAEGPTRQRSAGQNAFFGKDLWGFPAVAPTCAQQQDTHRAAGRFFLRKVWLLRGPNGSWHLDFAQLQSRPTEKFGRQPPKDNGSLKAQRGTQIPSQDPQLSIFTTDI